MTSVPSRSRGFTFRTVAVVFLALLAVGLVLGFVVYRKYVAYEPTASRHVPRQATSAIRVDLTHVMFYEPFRRSIFPLLDRGSTLPSSRRDRLEAAGLRVGSDVREVMLALGPGAGDWTVVLGGPLATHRVGPALAGVLREEGLTVESGVDGVHLLSGKGWAFAQAADGAFVLASSRAALERALSAGAAVSTLREGAGGFFATPPLLAPALGRVEGIFRAGSTVSAHLSVLFAGDPSAGERSLRGVLEHWAALDPALTQPFRSADVRVSGRGAQVFLNLPREAVERLVALAEERIGS